MTLAIGFGATPPPRRDRRGLAGAAASRRRAPLRRRLERLPASLKAPPAPVAGMRRCGGSTSSRCSCSPAWRTREPRRLDRRAEHAVDLGHAHARRRPQTSGPYHLVWPRDFYHAATAQKAAGDDAAADRLVDYLWRVQKPDGSFWQNTRVDGTPIWTSQQLDETSLPVVLAWWLGRTGADGLGHTSAPRPTTCWPTARARGQERWENQDGFSPNTIATEIAASCAPPTSRGQRRRRPRGVVPGHGRRRGRRRWRAGPRRPTAPTPPGPTTCASPRTATRQRLHVHARRQLPAPGRPARDRRQLVPGPRAVRRQAPRRQDDPQLAEGRRRHERGAAAGEHEERRVLAPLHVRRLRRAGETAATGTCSSTTRRGRRSGARGRCWRASAASTS